MNNVKIRQFVEMLPYCKTLGIEVADDDGPLLSLPYREELIGSPHSRVIHGGPVFALMDTACGAAIIAHPENGGATATLDLRVDYMRPATVGKILLARAEVYNTTRYVAFLHCRAWDDDPEEPVALATGTFTFVKKDSG